MANNLKKCASSLTLCISWVRHNMGGKLDMLTLHHLVTTWKVNETYQLCIF